MKKGDISYLLTVILFAVGFLGFAFFTDRSLYIFWMGALALGICSFSVRIYSGDD